MSAKSWFILYIGIQVIVIAGIVLFIIYRPGFTELTVDVKQIKNDIEEISSIKSDVKNISIAVNILTNQISHLPKTPLNVADIKRVTSKYDYRFNPLTDLYEFHAGTDISVNPGSVVFAAASGVVEFAGIKGGYGKYVKMNHLNGAETGYGHLSFIKTHIGAVLQQGDTIGITGNTGLSNGEHLHFEIFFNGKSINPQAFL